jgi:hypothetical protein
MAIRKISYRESLDVIWNEIIYTRARLEADSKTKDLAGALRDMVGRLFEVKQGQYHAWEGETVAQAQIDTLDFQLDEIVEEMAHFLDRIVRRDHQHPRWTRYLGRDNPFAIRRLGLASEIQRMGNWVESLKSESEPELKAIGTRLEQVITAGKDALNARERAAATRADHRARQIMTLVDDINALRLSIYGELISRTGQHHLPRTWPEEFFLHHTSVRTRVPSTTEETGVPATE